MNITKGLPNFTSDMKKSGNADHFYICASSCRGKSYILKEMYNKLYKDDNKLIILLISPSMNIDLFKDMKGNNIIKINKWNKKTDMLINKIVKIQIETENQFRILLMIDDCVDQYYNKTLNNLFLVNRNQQISTIMSCQYPAMLSKRARASVKNVICGGINSPESIKQMIDFFLKSQLTDEMKKKYPNKYPESKKINEQDIINFYKETTNKNDGHTFIWSAPQFDKIEAFFV
tara:strand:+ start:393 stop:1088 length:696 start_codon:yes stop_codon:yes gene_type:complete